MIWIFKKGKTENKEENKKTNCTIKMKNEYSRYKASIEEVYKFSFQIIDNGQLPEKETEIDRNNEWFHILKEVIIDYFSRENSLDMSDQNIPSSFFVVECREFLRSKKAGKAVENNKEDVVQLLLLQKFIQAAHVLTDPIRVRGISNSERKDISVFCYILRMYILKRIMELCLKEHYPQLRANVEKAYIEEFKRFCDYLYEESFQNYSLPDYIKEFFQIAYQTRDQGEIQLDDVVHWTIIDFLDSGIKKADPSIGEYVLKLSNGFYLPRYNILKYLCIQRRFGWKSFLLDLVFKVLLSPRLAASIVIGFLPILLTAELYGWYYDQIYKKHECGLELFSAGLLVLTFAYLWTETKNFLGFRAFQRVLVVFLIGLFISVGLVFFTKSVSVDILNGELSKGAKPFSHIPKSLFIFQIAAAYFLGIVLQAIWEDKPITQPL